eukprot:GHVR01091854.1.p1 GENE.GHVR01091854.1~~GHVR01091854.1.p1  ORF type:complete len:227 (-),score=42.32 GHVR01091854.1:218-898(-)
MQFGLLSSLLQAFYQSINKLIMPHCDNSPNKVLSYCLMWSIPMFLPAVWLSGEWHVWNTLPLTPKNEHFWSIWLKFIASGALAVSINSTLLCINYSSPIALNVVAMIKACIQTGVGFAVYRNSPTFANMFGVSGTIIGSFLYSLVVHLEGLEKKKKLEKQQKRDDLEDNLLRVCDNNNNNTTTNNNNTTTNNNSNTITNIDCIQLVITKKTIDGRVDDTSINKSNI